MSERLRDTDSSIPAGGITRNEVHDLIYDHDHGDLNQYDIAKMLRALPELLDEVAALRAERDELRTALKRVVDTRDQTSDRYAIEDEIDAARTALTNEGALATERDELQSELDELQVKLTDLAFERDEWIAHSRRNAIIAGELAAKVEHMQGVVDGADWFADTGQSGPLFVALGAYREAENDRR